jgi:anti-sigma B factor antagonist
MNFALSTQSVDGATVIAVSGEADLYTAPELKAELVQVIEAGARFVVVDLSRATFIDSTTLGVLISGVKRLRPGGGRIDLVIDDRSIRKVFEITGLDTVFRIHPDLQAALSAGAEQGGG